MAIVPCGFGDYSCCLCATPGNECVASFSDNCFVPATNEQLLYRIKSCKYLGEDIFRMKEVLRQRGVKLDDDKCTTDSLSEAINKCNEQLKDHPKFDFSGVEVHKDDTPEKVECRHCGLEAGKSLFSDIHTAAFGLVYKEIVNIRYCPLCGKKLDK